MQNIRLIGIASCVVGSNLIWAGLSLYHYKAQLNRAAHIMTIPSPSRYPFLPSEEKDDVVLQRNLFNVSGALGDATDGCKKGETKSTLPFTVLGIIYGGSSESSVAVLSNDSDHTVASHIINDVLQDSNRILEITKDRVYLSSGVCKTYIEISPFTLNSDGSNAQKTQASNNASASSYSEDGFVRSGKTINIKKQWLIKTIQNDLPLIITQVKALPYLADGKMQGFRLSQIKRNSVFQNLGLENDDIISAINGIPMNDASQAVATFNSLRSASKISISVIRNGALVTFVVNVQ